MAVQFKDYYKTLGVSRTASDDEMRKAFRKLAREYHPDVAKNKTGAEDKFKEINEAYEVLSDPQKRKKYDELGANWKQGAEFRPPPGWQGSGRPRSSRGQAPGGGGFEDFQFGGTGFSDFFEQLFGGRNGADSFRTSPRQAAAERGDDVEAELLVNLEEAINGSVRSISLRRGAVCQTCFGSGNVNNKSCPTCGGKGQVEKVDTYKVKIPAGVGEGQKLRVAGQGEAGAGGGPAGDLFLRVRFAKHPDFRVENGALYYDLEVAPWEAVLGANVSVPSLSGRVSIKLPPGTQNDQKLRLRERGMSDREGKKGDLIVVIKVQVPKQVTDAEKKLWEALSKESAFKPHE